MVVDPDVAQQPWPKKVTDADHVTCQTMNMDVLCTSPRCPPLRLEESRPSPPSEPEALKPSSSHP